MYAVKTGTFGALFLMPKPSGEWLEEDISHYKAMGVTHIISLLRDNEVEEQETCFTQGISFERFPITDRGLPDYSLLKILAESSAKQITDGNVIAIHCRAGIGRAGLLASCILQELGVEAIQALRKVSDARGVDVPDTEAQKVFIVDYSKHSTV
jgi:protein-tyrosine phosphatase